MTENQLYPMSADFFDTSSNSSALKIELFPIGLNDRSPLHQLTVSTGGFSSNSNSLSGYSPNKSAINFHNSSTNNNSNSNSNSSSLNVMLTNAITIPRSNNPNQSHNPYLVDDQQLQHHPNPSPLLNHQMMSSHQQQLQQQQQQQLQQQLQQDSDHFLVDFSDYGLEALDAASLSPTLLHDVSFTADSPLSTTLQSIAQADEPLASAFYAQDPHSPISHSGSNSVVGSVPNETSTLLGLNVGAVVHGDDVPNSLLFEGNANTNTMWSDIGSAIVTTKHEPFTLEEDYIFPIDKTEIQSINGDHFNGVSFDDLLPNAETVEASVTTAMQNGFFNPLDSPQPSPNGQLELLQQKFQLELQNLQRDQNDPQNQQILQDQLVQLQNLQTQQQQLMQTMPPQSSSYEFYHSTPNKQQNPQPMLANRFSPGSQSSNSPLQMNVSITPPPHANRSQYQQMVKSRNMQELTKKDFSMSPDRNTTQLGQSVPSSQLLMSGNALSPGSGSSGFGSATGASSSTTSASIRKSFAYQSNDSALATSRLSTSAPTHLGLEHLWKRREPRQHLLSTGSLAEAESFSSLSTASVLSPSCQDYSQDDDDDASSDFNSDHYDDFSSDNGNDSSVPLHNAKTYNAARISGSDNEDEGRTSTPLQFSSGKGKERFFWQYNVQAKGPKGKRLVFQSRLEDPHVLNEVTDPVFSPNCSVRGIKVFKHSGKARKGDGNDLTPNPRKLHSIGKELDKLSRTINDMTPVSELPFNVRPKSRKEKNKLASRACRLKKKAQHEANKIKNFGLEIEHKRLLTGIAEIKQGLLLKYQKQNSNEISTEIDQQIDRSYQTAITGLQIAGSSTNFVNKVLENVKAGIPHGGLDELRN